MKQQVACLLIYIPIYIYISLKLLPVQSIELLPGVGPIDVGLCLTVEVIHAMKCEFYEVALVGVKEHLDKYIQGQLLEREA